MTGDRGVGVLLAFHEPVGKELQALLAHDPVEGVVVEAQCLPVAGAK